MRRINHLIILLLLASVFAGCGDDATQMYTNITGKAGEMVVVISDDSWEGAPGTLIKETLAQPHVGLPQEEPLFDLIDVPHAAFKKIFRTTRNVLQTQISSNVDESGIAFTDDVWAYPQATVQIRAKTPEEFVKIFESNKDKILSYFILAEKERNTMNYKKVYEKAVYNTLDQEFGVTMKVPPGFRIMEKKKDFLWVQFDSPEITQGIVVYSYPYVSDSAFTVDYQLPIRDSLLKKYVPGPTDGSYMSTEKRLEQINNVIKHNGNYATEMRGLWRVENDFMGGPYVALSELDVSNQRVINAFGFVYAPSKDKRNLIRQVEAMIYSLKQNNQADNDKLNQQDVEIQVEG
ncbi:DUF4837 family protein [Draconibacterium sp. IB214405]|uniref:DUF4837 family protein n=1 Tax=Draconibacterium sp. IB214405 TaxID=3097352 RepID=UPI002A146DB9|nr:DUF4837 family protein [Draconibacterium sp. IB214405]MDX8337572.1 DUF4837 family protein [Draconibacterium sp. IB214405]